MVAESCDINKGLKETSKLEWSGDVDLTDGSLQEKYADYKKRLEMVKNVGLCEENMVQDLNDVVSNINKDLEFLQNRCVCGGCSIATCCDLFFRDYQI